MPDQSENYIILIDGQQSGPFSIERIRSMLGEGALDPSHLVWKEGFEDWTPISAIPDLLPVSHMPTSHDSEAKAKPKVTESRATFTEKIQTSAKLAAAQAKLEKLKRVDLNAAFAKLGEAAYQISFQGPDLQSKYDAIEKLNQQIGALREAKPVGDDAGMAEKAKRQLKKGKQAVEAEGLLHKQKNLFKEIGEVVALMEGIPPDLQQNMADLSAKQLQIAQVIDEIESLRSRVSGIFAKPGKVIAVVGVVLVLFVAWNFMVPRYENWKAGQEASKQQKLAEAEIANFEMESLQRRKKMEEEDRIATAEREKERLVQKITREEEEVARALAAERTRQERTLDEERRRMEAEAKRVQEEQNARIAAAAAQQDRAALAAKLLAAVPLLPEIALSHRLQQVGTSVEMRGENVELLRELQEKGDWLGLLGVLDGRQMLEYPDARHIESRVSRLQKSSFKILLKTQFQETRSAELYLITSPDHYSVVDYSTSWERHPDGIGYLHTWRPEDGPVIAVIGNDETAGNYLRKARAVYYEEMRALNQKKDLGELTYESFMASVTELRRRAYQDITQWAAGL